MSSTLQAKISVPRLPQVVIPQRGLSQCFERAQASEIVLVCAPAGYGKTTFVSSYCASSTRVSCWYSLDEPDNDPGVFGQYLVGSLAKCFSLSVELRYKAVHGGYQHILDLVRELLIELETQPTAACLVLDDCHHISHPSILSALQFFLIYLPVTIQAVLISRSEPAALSRLYSQRHVVRFASADLGLDETAVMALFSAHGQQLSVDGAQQLHRKTQGWVTGLKLIALNHSLTTDLAAIADTLPRREIQNYLFHEIYVKQDADLQRFLKQTAGAIVRETDGRWWLVAPSNGFGGHQVTFPKGRLEGKSAKATALIEVYEESGLQIRLLSYLFDITRTSTVTRYYLAERIGGNPADMGWESQAVMLGRVLISV